MSGVLKALVVRVLLKLGLYWPLFVLCRRSLIEVSPNAANKAAPVLLALNAERFRGELEALVKTGSFRVLKIPYNDQARYLRYFYDPIPRIRELYTAPLDSDVGRRQARYRRFLEQLMRSLTARFGLVGVVGANISYIPDVDWGVAAQRAGLSYVVLLRGGMVAAPGIRDDLIARFKTYGKIPCDLIAAHNEAIREVLVTSGVCAPTQVQAIGAPRMDSYMARVIAAPQTPSPRRKMVLLVSFAHANCLTGVGMFSEEFQEHFDGVWSRSGFGFVKLFASVHGAFGQLAAEHPGVDFVVKTKWGHLWFEKVKDAINSAGVDPDALPNLKLTSDSDIHDLILKADVVVAFGSTAVLEAGIAMKPLIVPDFAEAKEERYRRYILFHGVDGIFERAQDVESLKGLVLERMSSFSLAEENRKARQTAYEHYIGPLTGDATQTTASAIKELVARHSGARRENLLSVCR